MKYFQFILISLVFSSLSINSAAQYNPIKTAVPFLMTGPDARGIGLGNVGVSSSSDPNSMYWNPAKYGTINSKIGFSVTYYPFIHPDLEFEENLKQFLSYTSFYIRLGKRLVLASTFRRHSLGEIQFTDESGTSLGYFWPKENAFDVGLSIELTKSIFLGVAGRYIHSNLTQGQTVQGVETTAGKSFALDLALFWEKRIKHAAFSIGMNISNIGTKVSYTKSNIEKNFLPANFRIGSRISILFNEKNNLSFQFDINKLLVPTPPVYAVDSTGNPIPIPGSDKYVIEAGMDPNVSVIKGVFQSWYDAPRGFSEELEEYSFGFGVECLIMGIVTIRHGLYYQNENKGNGSFYSFGIGAGYDLFRFDFAFQLGLNEYAFYYQQNAYRFTILFNFGKIVEE